MSTQPYHQADHTGALTIEGFRARYNIGRTKTYEEINSGRLPVRKVGAKTLISVADAERWLAGLPPYTPKAA